jgi:hypothetical protein
MQHSELVEKGAEMSERAIIGRASHDITRLESFQYSSQSVGLLATICSISCDTLF